MNWEALGALAELLGAVGVIATLAERARPRLAVSNNRSSSRLSGV